MYLGKAMIEPEHIETFLEMSTIFINAQTGDNPTLLQKEKKLNRIKTIMTVKLRQSVLKT